MQASRRSTVTNDNLTCDSPVQRLIHDRVVDAIRKPRSASPTSPRSPSRCRRRGRSGDLAVPVAFQLARTLRKAPKAIAEELTAALGRHSGVAGSPRRRTAI
jgi:arginyl-tRNA synthetase